MNRLLKRTLFLLSFAAATIGCSNKINQTGGWLVTYDSTLTPRFFDSVKDSVKLTSSEVNQGLATGSSDSLTLGKVTWTESDLLIRFFAGLDSVNGAETILSGQIVLVRSRGLMQPAGSDVHNLQLSGYEMDSLWNPLTSTFDSVSMIGYGTTNIVTSQSISDSTVTMNIDTATIRAWATALVDTNVKNYGMIIKPTNDAGVLTVYSSIVSAAGDMPALEVVCIKNGVQDTVVSTSSNVMSAVQTTITAAVPATGFKIVQGGSGLRESLLFDLSSIPKFSLVNFAQLTVYRNPLDSLYSGNGNDSLYVYYIGSTSPLTLNTAYTAVSAQTGNKFVFTVTVPVQLMLNRGNYGFLIARYFEVDNVNASFIYDENAPDSLKPRLDITYAPVSKR